MASETDHSDTIRHERAAISPTPPRRRSIRRRALTGLGLLIVLLGAGYATLPVWLPKGWLIARISSDLGRSLGCVVHLKELDFGWKTGLTLRTLFLADPSRTDTALIELSEARCDVHPIGLLLGRGIERLELIDPVLHVRIDSAGRLNLGRLRGNWSDEPMTRRLEIRSCKLEVSDERSGTRIDALLGNVAIGIDPRTGRTHIDLQGDLIRDVREDRAADSGPSSAGRFITDAALTLPTARTSVQAGHPTAKRSDLGIALSGEGRLRWEDVDLSSLPIRICPGLSTAQLAGRCRGSIRTTVGADLEQHWELELQTNDFSFRRSAAEPLFRLAHGTVQATGRWQPTYDVVELQSFLYRMPGLEVRGRTLTAAPANVQPTSDVPVLVWSLHGETPLQARFVSHLTDAARVRDWLPERWLRACFGDKPHESNVAGGLIADTTLTRSQTGWRLDVDASSHELTLGPGCPLTLDSQTNARLVLRGSIADGVGVAELDSYRLRVGPTSISGHARWPLESSISANGKTGAATHSFNRAAWLTAALARTRFDFDLQTSDAADVTRRLPGLAAALGASRVSGPMRASGTLHGGTDSTIVEFNLGMDGAAACQIPGWLNKEPGRALSCGVSAVLFTDAKNSAPASRVFIRYGRGELTAQADSTHASSFRLAVHRDDSAASDFSYDAAAALPLSIRRVQDLADLMPPLAQILKPGRTARSDDAFALTGDASIQLNADAHGMMTQDRWRPVRCRVDVSLDAGPIAVSTDQFHKSAGEAARASMSYSFDDVRSNRMQGLIGRVESPGWHASFNATRGADSESADIDLVMGDASLAAKNIPLVDALCRENDLRGGATLKLTMSRSPAVSERTIRLDATELGLLVRASPGAAASRTVFAKNRGVACTLTAKLDALADEIRDPAGPTRAARTGKRWQLTNMDGVLADCRFHSAHGRFDFNEGFVYEVIREASAGRLEHLLQPGAIGLFEIDADTTMLVDATLRSLSPALAAAADQYDLVGRCDGQFRLRGDRDGLHMAGTIEGTRLNARVPGLLNKSAGLPARIHWDVAAQPAADGVIRLTLNNSVIDLPGTRVSMQGQGTIGPRAITSSQPIKTPTTSLLDARVNLAIDCTGLDQLDRVCDRSIWPPALHVGSDAGAIHAQSVIRWDGSRIVVDPSTARLEDIRCELRAVDGTSALMIALDGDVEYAAGRLSIPAVNLRTGRTQLSIGGELTGFSPGPQGTLIVSGRYLDGLELLEAIARVFPPAGSSSDAARPSSRSWLDTLGRCELKTAIHTRSARFPGLSGGAPFNVDELNVDLRVTGGRLDAPFACALNGGVVKGSYSMALREVRPYFDLNYTARDLAPDDSTRPIVEKFFPGMVVHGRMTLIDRSHQLLIAEPGAPNFPVGSGEMRIEGGTIVGRAAPTWVTRVFPGLNMARYEFTRMSNQFVKLADGRQKNLMTFLGPYYHVYVDGYSLATGDVRYEVGVDLLARVSPDLSRIGQGRVPLFIKTGIVRKGKMEDEVVSYLTPSQVSQRIWNNNLLTNAYYAVKKQVAGL